MRRIIFFSLFIITVIIHAQEQSPVTFHQHDINNGGEFHLDTPFPQCFTTESAPPFLQPKVIERIFDVKLREEDRKLKQEQNRNIQLNNGKFQN
jgi:uncharacterized membrane protein YciS (DUF1049 family)